MLGIDFISADYKDQGKNVQFKIWDTAGQERFGDLTSSFYQRAQGLILVYDVTSLESFTCIERWIDSIERNTDIKKLFLVLAGNKIDLVDERVVKKEDAEKVALKYGMTYFETSAKANQNIEELVNFSMQETYKKAVKLSRASSVLLDPNAKKSKSGCCQKSGKKGSS